MPLHSPRSLFWTELREQASINHYFPQYRGVRSLFLYSMRYSFSPIIPMHFPQRIDHQEIEKDDDYHRTDFSDQLKIILSISLWRILCTVSSSLSRSQLILHHSYLSKNDVCLEEKVLLDGTPFNFVYIPAISLTFHVDHVYPIHQYRHLDNYSSHFSCYPPTSLMNHTWRMNQIPFLTFYGQHVTIYWLGPN